MKKFILTLAIVVSFVGVIKAQADGKTIGLRLGYPTEISFQTGLSNANRLELGLGFRTYNYGNGYNYTQFSLSGVYQWVWDLKALADGFNWYAGAGASLGYYSFSYLNTSGYPIAILGQVGIEYNFAELPLRLSLDYRPALQLTGARNGFLGNGFIGDGIALGIRYRLK